MSSLRGRYAAVALAVTAWGACALYDPSLLGTSLADAGHNATDAGADADAAEVCAYEHPPARPSVSELDGGSISFTSAFSSVDVGSDAKSQFSYDLDQACSCPAPESCTPTAGAPPHCDALGGRDNSGGALFAKFALLGSDLFSPDKISLNISEGRIGMLLRVTGYNGMQDDSRVELSIFVSDGISPIASHPKPKRDGTDPWTVDDSCVLGGAAATKPYRSLYVDTEAYVAGGRLVGNLDFPFAIGGSQGLSLDLKGGVLTGALKKVASGYAVTDGRIAGRWPTRAVLTSMQYIPDPIVAGGWLCGKNLTYGALKNEICKFADLSAEIQNDNTNAPCRALSLGLGFTAEPAQFAEVIAAGQKLHPCGASYDDECGP